MLEDAVAPRLPIVVGTRGSPLAMAQTRVVCTGLAALHPALARPGAMETRTIATTGDRFTDRPLAEIGGKALFTKEIDEALRGGRIDFAVHSMKDVPTLLPADLVVAAIPPREDPRDVLITPPGRPATSIAGLTRGARIGTSSPRRAAQLLAWRPDLAIVPLRGNVATRLRKLANGESDAILLALAGLRRLGETPPSMTVLEPGDMLSAAGQGALAVQCRAEDDAMQALLAPLSHGPSAAAVRCERTLLEVLEGTCRAPIAGLAVADDAGSLHLDALIARPDGEVCHRLKRSGTAADAAAIGREAGEALKTAGGARFFDP